MLAGWELQPASCAWGRRDPLRGSAPSLPGPASWLGATTLPSLPSISGSPLLGQASRPSLRRGGRGQGQTQSLPSGSAQWPETQACSRCESACSVSRALPNSSGARDLACPLAAQVAAARGLGGSRQGDAGGPRARSRLDRPRGRGCSLPDWAARVGWSSELRDGGRRRAAEVLGDSADSLGRVRVHPVALSTSVAAEAPAGLSGACQLAALNSTELRPLPPLAPTRVTPAGTSQGGVRRSLSPGTGWFHSVGRLRGSPAWWQVSGLLPSSRPDAVPGCGRSALRVSAHGPVGAPFPASSPAPATLPHLCPCEPEPRCSFGLHFPLVVLGIFLMCLFFKSFIFS